MRQLHMKRPAIKLLHAIIAHETTALATHTHTHMGGAIKQAQTLPAQHVYRSMWLFYVWPIMRTQIRVHFITDH